MAATAARSRRPGGYLSFIRRGAYYDTRVARSCPAVPLTISGGGQASRGWLGGQQATRSKINDNLLPFVNDLRFVFETTCIVTNCFFVYYRDLKFYCLRHPRIRPDAFIQNETSFLLFPADLNGGKSAFFILENNSLARHNRLRLTPDRKLDAGGAAGPHRDLALANGKRKRRPPPTVVELYPLPIRRQMRLHH